MGSKGRCHLLLLGNDLIKTILIEQTPDNDDEIYTARLKVR
jgi:hypothetical protein